MLLFIINQVNNGNWLLNSYLIATFVFIILWSDVLICTFSKISTSYKVSFSLILWVICIALTNPICYKILNIPNSEDNIGNIICSIIMILCAIGIYIKKSINK